jgi:outer membrane protein, heavy metal efflux system
MQIRRLVAAFALLLSPAAYAVDWSDPQSLVALAQANDPGLVRMRAEVAAARERVVPAAARPNPMLMGGIQNKMIDLRDDDMMTMYMVGASQTFVSREKRDARRSAAELTVASVEAQLASVQVEIERDVLFAWYDIAAIDEQLREIDAVRNLIDAIVGAARVRYEVGSAAQSEVIRGQLEKSDLDHRVIELRGDRRPRAAS